MSNEDAVIKCVVLITLAYVALEEDYDNMKVDYNNISFIINALREVM